MLARELDSASVLCANVFLPPTVRCNRVLLGASLAAMGDGQGRLDDK